MCKFTKITHLLFLLFGIFLISIVFVNPLGEFALNDDWFYVDAVKRFSLHGFTMGNWITPSLIGQVLYAKLFTSLFGFSLSVLRLSTLLLSGVGMLFFYLLLRALQLPHQKVFFISLLLFFNPLFFHLSFTFMTDIPALAFAIVGLYFYKKGFLFWQEKYLWFAHLCIIYAGMIRQNYLVLLLIFAFIFVFEKRKSFSVLLVAKAFLPLAFAFVLVSSFQYLHWWPQRGFSLHTLEFNENFFIHLVRQTFFLVQYMALFLAPFL